MGQALRKNSLWGYHDFLPPSRRPSTSAIATVTGGVIGFALGSIVAPGPGSAIGASAGAKIGAGMGAAFGAYGGIAYSPAVYGACMGY